MKKVPETDAIFARLAEVTPAADADPTILRMSVDAKATVLLGRFSRGGASRVTIKALDHDFRPTEKVTPLGVFLPAQNEVYLYFITGPGTADTIVDVIRMTRQQVAPRFPQVDTLHLTWTTAPKITRGAPSLCNA